MVENNNTIKDPELATAPLRIHPSINILVSLFSNLLFLWLSMPLLIIRILK